MKELRQLKKLIQQIRDSGEKYDFILAPARGGLVPAQFIAYALDIKVIHVINNVKGGYPRSQPTQKCLLVDDINDTSYTVEAMVAFMKNNNRCDVIDVAVIFQRFNSPFKAQFVGDIIEDKSWVDFTWDKEIV